MEDMKQNILRKIAKVKNKDKYNPGGGFGDPEGRELELIEQLAVYQEEIETLNQKVERQRNELNKFNRFIQSRFGKLCIKFYLLIKRN